MKDVAAIAGVSVSTVSRVINNAIPVGARTRELVEQAIGEVNYRPNLLASGLRSKSGNLIGLAVPEIGHQSFDTFIKYIEEYARANKYGLILGDIQNDADGEADFIDQLIRRNVDGIIFIRVSDESRALEMLNSTTIPYVVLDRGASTATAPTVVMDNHQAGRLAAEHLIALGHRDVACVTGPLNVSLCRDRLDGFTQTVSAAGLRLLRHDIHESDFRFESGVKLVPALLERGPPVTALWAQNDLMAIGIMAGLKDHGLSVPRDVSVIGVDDIVSCRMLRPQLTTVRQPFREMSRAAVELLLRESALGERISEKIAIPTELVVRQSTAPPLDVRSERQPVSSRGRNLAVRARGVPVRFRGVPKRRASQRTYCLPGGRSMVLHSRASVTYWRGCRAVRHYAALSAKPRELSVSMNGDTRASAGRDSRRYNGSPSPTSQTTRMVKEFA